MKKFENGDVVYVKFQVLSVTEERNGEAPYYLLRNVDNDSNATGYICTNVVYGMDEAGTYRDGLEAAWRAITKLALSEKHGGIPDDCVENIFGKRELADIVLENTPEEVVSKIGDWEKEGIHKGSVVRLRESAGGKTGVRGVVVSEDEGKYGVLWEDGEYREAKMDNLLGTGCACDLKDLLRSVLDGTSDFTCSVRK